MPKTGPEMTKGMQEALDKEKAKGANPKDLKLVGVQDTGMAMDAAKALVNRKKALDEIK